ncbi:hypothetical protein Ciccas_005303 [Cichlidogyrus casuarinus]|uniref:Uncharacterized protein n=1 Tax=Cichlidogyrus casuarinus TaxID=1844966 RepID=A0ABD2Q907_9PLAT
MKTLYVEANKTLCGFQDLTSFDKMAHKLAVQVEKDLVSESRSPEIVSIESIRSITLEYLRSLYKRMGVSFDHFEFESDYIIPSRNLFETLKSRNLIRQSATGAWISDPDPTSTASDKEIVLFTSSDTSLYLSRSGFFNLMRLNRFSPENWQHT